MLDDSGQDDKGQNRAEDKSAEENAANASDPNAQHNQTVVVPATDDGKLQVKEFNPELILLVNGNEEAHRYMKLEKKEKFGPDKTLLTLPPVQRGVQGFSHMVYPQVVVYLPFREFLAKALSGTVLIDLTDDCLPPGFDRDVGKKTKEGLVYAGASPDTGKGMFIEATDEQGGKRMSLREAEARAARKREETGLNWHVPSLPELKRIFYYSAYSDRLSGFDQGEWYPESGYWSCTGQGMGKAAAMRFSKGSIREPVQERKGTALHVRLVCDGKVKP